MKLKFLYYLCTVIIVFAVACTDNDRQTQKPEEEKPAEDSTVEEVQDSTFSRETIDSFSTTAFSTYAKKQSAAFDWSKFRLTNTWTEDSMLVSAFKPNKEYFDAYGPFLKYSPDSTLFIDLDSYNIGIKKDSKGQLVGTEYGPDLEVSLIDINTKKKTRLLFLGPGGSVADAMWLDKENLVLMGVQDYGDSTGKIAAAWKFNIPTKTYYLYELQDAALAQQLIAYWRKEHLKGVLEKN